MIRLKDIANAAKEAIAYIGLTKDEKYKLDTKKLILSIPTHRLKINVLSVCRKKDNSFPKVAATVCDLYKRYRLMGDHPRISYILSDIRNILSDIDKARESDYYLTVVAREGIISKQTSDTYREPLKLYLGDYVDDYSEYRVCSRLLEQGMTKKDIAKYVKDFYERFGDRC